MEVATGKIKKTIRIGQSEQRHLDFLKDFMDVNTESSAILQAVKEYPVICKELADLKLKHAQLIREHAKLTQLTVGYFEARVDLLSFVMDGSMDQF